MREVAKFEKVSSKQFAKDMESAGFFCEDYAGILEEIMLPKRATVGSAGYDFFSPVKIVLKPGEERTIPTGIRVSIEEGYLLSLYPRSGLGFRYRMQLNNTVGIVDSDYYHARNEGHILARITNGSVHKDTLEIKVGQGFIQGIFLPFGITVDDAVTETRRGGFGSTTQE